jgi:hypothetical protein
MEQGWDPEIKSFFKKIMNSISITLLWLLIIATAGLYFGLAFSNGKPVLYTVIFYIALTGSFAWLVVYLYRTWNK